MNTARLEEMVRGWFVGNFEPSLYRTNQVEVAVKHYRPGQSEGWHYHRLATEVTVVISGEVGMNGQRYRTGDIVVMEPGEGTDFQAFTETVTVVVKIPGANDDKYFGEAGRTPGGNTA